MSKHGIRGPRPRTIYGRASRYKTVRRARNWAPNIPLSYLQSRPEKQPSSTRRTTHHPLLSSSLFLFHVFDMLACCFHSPPGDLKLPGKREFGWRYALARYEDAPFFFFFFGHEGKFLKMKQGKQ